ncbi:hypothetical protein OROMI_005915 [Orobanche minor]
MSSSKNSNLGSLLSCEDDCGDLIVLPPKKKKEPKRKNQVSQNKQPKLSKSQNRKLKKLEEEKQKEKLLLESIKTLEKHKIPNYAYSLVFSSTNLGQVETVREKRKREVQISKLLHIHKLNKKQKVDSACQSHHVQEDDDDTQPQAINDSNDSRSSLTEVVMREGSMSDSDNMACNNENITFHRDGVQSDNEMTCEVIQPSDKLPKKPIDSCSPNQELTHSIV